MKQYLSIAGYLESDGKLALKPGFLSAAEAQAPAWDGSLRDDKREVIVELVDTSAAVLLRYSLPLVPACVLADVAMRAQATPLFAVLGQVPFLGETRAIRYLVGGKVVAEQGVSKHAPEVELHWKPPPEVAGTHRLSWKATHADGASLSFIVCYSNDAGKTWQPLSTELGEKGLDVAFDELPGGKGLISVWCSDGVNTTVVTSNPFRVAMKGTRALILSPLDNSESAVGQPLWLVGQGYELAGETGGDFALAWSSSVDGDVGVGELVSANLSRGQHVITLRAGKAPREGYASVTVNVLEAEERGAVPGHVVGRESSLDDRSDPKSPTGPSH